MIAPAFDRLRGAALEAVSTIRDGMTVGVAASEAMLFIFEGIKRRKQEGAVFQVVVATTSMQSIAQQFKLTAHVDDGSSVCDVMLIPADEVDDELNITFGSNMDFGPDSQLARRARQVVVVTAHENRVAKIGAAPIPIEVDPNEGESVVAQLEFEAILRRRSSLGLDLTARKTSLYDARFLRVDDAPGVEALLLGMKGVLSAGILARRPGRVFFSKPTTTAP